MSAPPSLPPSPLPQGPDGLQDEAWIEVIRKMEEVYSDLIRHEIDLERKNAALEEAQQFINSVVSSVSDILIVCDTDGQVQQVNRALVDLTGFTEAEVIGRPVRALFHDDGALPARFCERLAELRSDGVRDLEARLNARDGLTDPVAVNCSTRFDVRGRPAGLVLIGRPVGELRRAYQALNAAHAELKQAQQQLVQSEKMASLGRLVAGVAHELNNPISFVYGNVHSMARYRDRLTRYLDAIHGGIDEAGREALRKELRIDKLLADLGPLIDGTLEGAVRVSDIVKNLRRLSFPGQGEPQTVDLSEVVATAAQWAAKGRSRKAEVACQVPHGLTTCGHAGQLHQVVVNLVQNALDAVEGDAVEGDAVEGDAVEGEALPTVHLSGGTTENGGTWVAVEDSGPGIPPDHLLKVFDPFFTTKSVGQGTGLGLWISYGIIRDHGGELKVENRSAGGARFCLTLPPPLA